MRHGQNRGSRRHGPEALGAARDALQRIDLVAIDDRILDAAGHLHPEVLRSLDAIHVATALALGDDLDVVVTFDQRMIEASSLMGSRPPLRSERRSMASVEPHPIGTYPSLIGVPLRAEVTLPDDEQVAGFEIELVDGRKGGRSRVWRSPRWSMTSAQPRFAWIDDHRAFDGVRVARRRPVVRVRTGAPIDAYFDGPDVGPGEYTFRYRAIGEDGTRTPWAYDRSVVVEPALA